VLHLISAYQRRGHENANLDPLGINVPAPEPDLDPATYGFTDADWERPLQLGLDLDNVAGLMGNADVNNDGATTLNELMSFLKQTYCGSIGVEYTHITDTEKLNWLRGNLEVHHKPLEKAEKIKILTWLGDSELFEGMLATKFNAAKRFGLEGCEVCASVLANCCDVSLLDTLSLTPPVDDPWSQSHDRALLHARRKGCHCWHGPPRPSQRADECDGQAT
jgi:2-oxoglutarate dehydrogenase E1 component